MLLRVVAILLLLWLAVELAAWLMKVVRHRLKHKMDELERELRQRAAGAARAGSAAPPGRAASSRTSRPAKASGGGRLVRCATCGVHFPAPPGTSGAQHADVYCSEGCERAAAAGPS